MVKTFCYSFLVNILFATCITASPFIGVQLDNPGTTFDVPNWTLAGNFVSPNISNLIDESGNPTGIDFSRSLANLTTASGTSFLSSQIPQHPNNLDPGIGGTSRSVNDVIFTFSNVPSGLWEYYIFGGGHRTTQNIVNVITDIDSDSFTEPVHFKQLYINGQLGDSNLNLTGYARTISVGPAGFIDFDIKGPGGNVLWEVAAIAIHPSSNANVPEPSTLGLFALVLLGAACRRRRT